MRTKKRKCLQKMIVALFTILFIVNIIQLQVMADEELSEDVLVDSISITNIKETFVEGENLQLDVEILPEDATLQNVNWLIEDESIIKVDENGYMTALKNGKTTITAYIEDLDGTIKNDIYTVKVVDENGYITLEGLETSSYAYSLIEGEKETLSVQMIPSSAEIKSIKWSSNDTSIAKVSKKGVVTAKGEGQTKIRVEVTPESGYVQTLTFTIIVESEEIEEDEEDEVKKEVVVVLDAGHGGSDSGAVGHGLYERNVNLQIALACKEELEKYSGIKVYITRTSNNTYLSLSERAKFASNNNADLLVSIHNNASSNTKAKGAEVYVSVQKTSDKFNKDCKVLGNLILTQLSKIGLEKRGVYARQSESTSSVRDYYGIIRNSYNLGIPAIIIEHGFITGPDYVYMNSTTKTKKLGVADAIAIAQFYNLSKK